MRPIIERCGGARLIRGVAITLASIALIGACTNDDPTALAAVSSSAPAPPSPPPSVPETSISSTGPTSTAPSSTGPTIPPNAARSRTPLLLDPARFSSSIEELDEIVSARVIGSSWREGCPMPIERLRYVEVTHHTNDGGSAIGELVVDETVAEDIVAIFARLYETGFPIESMRLVDDFDADDLRSMQANNTSAFNCRFVAETSNWSWHAYGRAIDINPLVNPFVTPAGVEPPEGEPYVDRAGSTIGMIRDGDAVTIAFADRGWEWGGNWHSGQDYQHFARTNA